MRNYKTRYEYSIANSKEQNKRNDDWFASFEEQLTKQAVKSKREDDSLFNQINGIINNSKNGAYRSVEDKVKEMQERSGYLTYSSSSTEGINNKIADKEEVKKNSKPQLLMLYPQIEITINNYLNDTKGTQDVPAILSHIRTIHKQDTNEDKLWEAEDLIKFIDKLNKSKENTSKETGNNNLGRLERHDHKDVDPSNYDAFHSLMPVTR